MKLSLYFLFYVAMVLELLIFIVDRDAAEERVAVATKTMLQQLSSVDEVKVFGTKALKLGEIDTVELAYHTFTLISDSERASIQYQIKRSYFYEGASLGEFTDMTLSSGAEVSKTEAVRAQVKLTSGQRVWKSALVTVQLSRDNSTGDALVRMIHSLPPPRRGGGVDTSFREGVVFVEVLPVLKRSFPSAFRSNPQLLQFMREHWNIEDVNNFWPRCISDTTMIDFRATGTILAGPGSGTSNPVQ
jgi:hypothetical protein